MVSWKVYHPPVLWSYDLEQSQWTIMLGDTGWRTQKKKKKKKKKRCTWRNQYLEACYYGEHTGHFLLVKTELQKQQLNRSLNEEGRNLKVEFMAWSPLQARVMCLASTVKRQDTQLKWDRRLEFWFKLAENSLLPESKQYVPKQSYNLKWWGN